MSLRLIINTALAIAFISLLTSCAPGSSEQKIQNFDSQQTSNDIIGGVVTSSDYQKANGIVGLLLVTENSAGEQMSSICTGSLIAKNTVLTAAHCLVVSPQVNVVAALVFFDKNLNTIMNEISKNNYSNVRSITKVLRHESYMKDRGSNNDIGLIQFEGSTPENFQLAQLADAQTSRTLRKGTEVTLAGFGVSTYKMDPSTGQINKSGSGVLRSVSKIKFVNLTATGQELVFDQTQGRGACHGDSGGPAYIVDQVTRKVKLIGVTSRGTQAQGLCDRQAIYTSVMAYGSWIANGLKKLATQ